MQTTFSLIQLADPNIAEADKILRACVHCGFCTATCPTYVLLGDERDSPRGRIYLIKEMLERNRPATKDVVTHIDRCLSCLSCMTTCPSGVHYMHLVDHARAHIEETYRRPLFDRLMREFLVRVMPYPRRLRLAMLASALARPLAPVFSLFGLKPLAAALRLAPRGVPGAMTETGTHPAHGPRRARVAVLGGCANEALMPSITQSTIRVLNRNGVEAVLPPDAGCCGSLEHHLGREEGAFAKARANVDAWTREIEGQGLDAILVTLSGCGTTVKDYGFMLRNDPAYAAKAAKVSSLAKDVSQSPLTPPARSSTARRCIGNRRTCSRLVDSTSRRCRRRICAAARPAPTTFSSRRSPGACATARWAISRRQNRT
jgi:glycolate oxidase iron-sulfur subunit